MTPCDPYCSVHPRCRLLNNQPIHYFDCDRVQEHRKCDCTAAEDVTALLAEDSALVQVGWMLSADLAAEFGITPLDDDYMLTSEQAEQDGGIKPEFQDRVIPVYRKDEGSAHA